MYVIAQAEVGPVRPINSTLARVHLPNGPQIFDAQLDGEPAPYMPFTEQGRPSMVVDVDLPPREPRTVTVVFQGPLVEQEASVTAQPLVLPQGTEIVPQAC